MYLTNFREQCLKDIITQLEPGLFKKVTGLEVKGFDLLVSLEVFNDSLMNDAVYKLCRYEDASMSYTGIEKHEYDARVGLFNTSSSREDYKNMKRRDSLLDVNRYAVGPASVDASDAKSSPAKNERHELSPKHAAPGATTMVSKPESAPTPTDQPNSSNSTAQPKHMRISKEELNKIGKGSTVYHKVFGAGHVVSIVGDRITINLDGKDRVFNFPDSFYRDFLHI